MVKDHKSDLEHKITEMDIYNYELKDWEDYVTGILLAENEEWVLLNEIPADYVSDGYCLVNKQQLVDHFKDDDTDLKEKVLGLKGFQPQLPQGVSLANIDDMLRAIEQHYHIFGVQDEEESIQIGTIQSIVANELRLNYINSYGEMDDATSPPIFKTDIQTVTFGTDYLYSIYLLWKNQM